MKKTTYEGIALSIPEYRDRINFGEPVVLPFTNSNTGLTGYYQVMVPKATGLASLIADEDHKIDRLVEGNLYSGFAIRLETQALVDELKERILNEIKQGE